MSDKVKMKTFPNKKRGIFFLPLGPSNKIIKKEFFKLKCQGTNKQNNNLPKPCKNTVKFQILQCYMMPC